MGHLKIVMMSLGQGLKRFGLALDGLAMSGVDPSDGGGNELLVGLQIFEVARPTKEKGIIDFPLKIPMGTFNGPILMGLTTIVTTWCHAVVLTKLVIAAGQVLVGLLIKITKGCRQTVGAMFPWHATERPEGILETSAKDW